MEDWDGDWYWAKYSGFSVGPESGQYRLSVTGFNSSSTAGDAMPKHNGQQFSAKDRDTTTSNCVKNGGWGGWWYENCKLANPCGKYYSDDGSHLDGILWGTVQPHGPSYSFKTMIYVIVPA